MKTCTSCGEEKPLSAFHKQSKGKSGVTSSCKECRVIATTEWRSKNPDKCRNVQLRHKFGISIEEYRAMEAAQGGLCAICKEKCSSGRTLAVDHNHTTGKNRALLCGNCNRGIGNLRESPAILFRAIEYLNTWNN